MSLGETLTLTLGATPYACVRSGDDASSSYYRLESSTELLEVRVRQSRMKADANGVSKYRHNVECVLTTYATASDPERVQKTYLVLERVPGDISNALVDGLADWLIASSNANLDAVIQGQT